MAASFFFYDLETSGINPRSARVMQFAGQRTDMDLKPIGESVNVLIKLARDILPEPDAILITGITPQTTLADGMTEAEFLKLFDKQIVKPGTIFTGFNSIRFDDEFMRFLLYRNFYDAYEWEWSDSRSRWDMLDVVRMTRALRPDGIMWPMGPDGKPSNRLELLSSVNKLDHANAHDALSDVRATIAVAKLICDKQPKLFQFLLGLRDKKSVAKLVEGGEPFVYTSGRYPSEFHKTTVVTKIADAPNGGAIVYDLRYDPAELDAITDKELAQRLAWQPRGQDELPPLPVKVLRFNRCPAIAPLSVLDANSQERIGIDMKNVTANYTKLTSLPKLASRLERIFANLEKERNQTALVANEYTVDGQLYSGFLGDSDRAKLSLVRAAKPAELGTFDPSFADARLHALLPLYKARNYPEALTPDERESWEKFCAFRLFDGGSKSQLARYFERLQTLAGTAGLTQNQQYLLEELRLYGESLMPAEPLG